MNFGLTKTAKLLSALNQFILFIEIYRKYMVYKKFNHTTGRTQYSWSSPAKIIDSNYFLR